MLYNHLDFGMKKKMSSYKTLNITIPEDLDYNDVFEELLEEYTSEYELMYVKTTNMGSLFKLTYNMVLKYPDQEKELIDNIRCRNGNLEISISRQATENGEL